MPYTDEFNKLRRQLRNQYSDKAKADTFAYKKALDLGIPTFKDRQKRFKKLRGSVLD